MSYKFKRSSTEIIDLENKAEDTSISDSVITDGNVLDALKSLKTEVGNKLNSNANAVSASKLATTRTISLTGDVTGSVSFNGTANASITTTVADDSHNHIISNIDDLQTSLDVKLGTITLASGTDLDTIYDNGIYVSNSDGNSQTILNRPPGTQGFVVYVSTIYGNGFGGRQIQYAISRVSKKVYVRDKSENSAWTAWIELYSTGSKPSWSDIQSKPSSFSPSSHEHNDLYYTESEIDIKLGDKTDIGHTHTSSNITDATESNTANRIVKRNASGNFSAGTITATLSGNASTATKLQTARTIAGTSFDGSANINISYTNLTNKPTIPEGVVVNNTLTSTSTTESLSANQGRILKGLADGSQTDVNNKLLLQSTEPTTQSQNSTWLQKL